MAATAFSQVVDNTTENTYKPLIAPESPGSALDL